MMTTWIPPKERTQFSELEQKFPDGRIFACDFYISGAEKGAFVPGGYEVGRVVNIDHHAPTERMSSRRVSSATLAIERVSAFGLQPHKKTIVINHTDCDSVLSAAILAGDLPPDNRFGEAALAADHEGAEHPIADLLQGMQHRSDYEFSLRNLKLMLTGKPIETEAMSDLQIRKNERELAGRSLSKFTMIGAVAFAELGDDTDSAFYVNLLPAAAVILIAVPRMGEPGKMTMKLRLSTNAPAGLSLNALRLKEFDPGYGGRWNAGANKRGSGVGISAQAYAEEVARRMEKL